MPSRVSTAKNATTKKASPSNKTAGKKVKASKPKPAAKPAAKRSKAVTKAGSKKPAVKRAVAKTDKVSKPKTAAKKPAEKKASAGKKAAATAKKVPELYDDRFWTDVLLDDFYAAHPHLYAPVVHYTFLEGALEKDNRYASKVGGHPFWPASKAWDKSTMGSLRLFMQINFADVPSNHGIAGMPTDGILQIFWNNFKEASNAKDKRPQGPDTFVIRYWSAEEVAAASSDEKLLSTDALPRLEGDNSMMGLDPTMPHGIEFRKPADSKMFATDSDPRFKAAFSKWVPTLNLEDSYACLLPSSASQREMLAPKGDGWLGGSPEFLSGEHEFCRLDEPEPYELMLYVTSGGPLMLDYYAAQSFYCRPARLAARDFSHVLCFNDH